MPCSGEGSLAYAPLLVGAAVAGPELEQRAVRGPVPAGVEAQPGLDAGDGAVGVDVPLLVGAGVAVPDDRRGAVGRSLAGGVQALAGHDELLARREAPPLVRPALAVPEPRLGAVGRVGDVDAATRLAAHEHDVLR